MARGERKPITDHALNAVGAAWRIPGATLIAAWLVGVGVTCYLFYPGYLSHDSLAQYVQVKTDVVYNHHPPAMVYLWRALDRVIDGSGGVFLFHVSLFWTGTVLAAGTIARSWYGRVLLALVLGFWPVHLITLAQISKDAAVLASFMLASGLLLASVKRQRAGLLVAGVMALSYGGVVRHNSGLAAVPFFFALGWLWYLSRGSQGPRLSWQASIAALGLAVGLGIGTYYVNQVNVRQLALWPSLAVWDLAAISLETNRLLLPASVLTEPRIDLNRLSDLFSPVSNVPLCRIQPDSGRREVLCREAFQWRKGEGLDRMHLPELFGDWLSAALSQPGAYARHRLRLTAYLLGFQTSRELRPFHVGSVRAEDFPNAPLSDLGIRSKFVARPMHDEVVKGLRAMEGSAVFRGWPYLLTLIGTTVFFLAQARRQGLKAPTVVGLAVCASGFLYTLPLLVLAAAAEFRYLIWLVAAALLTLALAGRHEEV